MKRNKKIVMVSHCILNVNSKVHGLALESSGNFELVKELMLNGYGIIQLPCIEQDMGGIMRWGQVKDQLDFPNFRNRCRERLKPIIDQICDFADNGYDIKAVIGANGSPTCGVDYTCSGNWSGEIGEGYGLEDKIKTVKMVPCRGVMMDVLYDMLKEVNLEVLFLAISEDNPDISAIDIVKKIR